MSLEDAIEFEIQSELDFEAAEAFLGIVRDESVGESIHSHYFPISGLAVCERQVFFKKSGLDETDPLPDKTKILMVYGEELHGVTYRRLDRMGLYSPMGEERKHNDEIHRIVYMIDKYLRENGETFVGEIKSIGKWGWEGYKGSIGAKDAPKDYHYLQVQTEMFLKGLRGKLVYLNRESGEMCIHTLEINKNAAKEMFRRAAIVGIALEENKPPARRYDCLIDDNGIPKVKWQRDKVQYKSDHFCFSGSGWCPFLSICYADKGIDGRWRDILGVN